MYRLEKPQPRCFSLLARFIRQAARTSIQVGVFSFAQLEKREDKGPRWKELHLQKPHSYVLTLRFTHGKK